MGAEVAEKGGGAGPPPPEAGRGWRALAGWGPGSAKARSLEPEPELGPPPARTKPELGGEPGADGAGEAADNKDTFEVQVVFVRGRGAGGFASWPERLQLARAAPGGPHRVTLRRDKQGCWMASDAFGLEAGAAYRLLDGDDAWCTLKFARKAGADGGGWRLEVLPADERSRPGAPGEGGEGGEAADRQPRWAHELDVSIIGQARGATCLLSGETASSRRIASGVRKGSLAAIREDEDTARAAAAAAEAEGTAQLLQLARPGGGGGGAVAEDDDLTWFSAGVRIGVGVGLGVCIGAGLGVGLLLKSYSSATQALGRRLGRVAA